jgi:excisionase family DNA binding protein
MRPLYTIQELAHTLRLQPGTVRNKLSRGEDLPRSVVVGRRRLFPEEAVEAWLQAQEARQAVPSPGKQAAVEALSLLAGPEVLRVLERPSADPDAERLGALCTAPTHRRRSRSSERVWSEEGRIGSWVLPLKRSHACMSSRSSPVA